ncbi:Bug family tripartite tricarboxylate transporter substrate binding protein [Azohydromonas caseinilytica]|uniref:Tripartite tricarboxylate transporter substrate binding protein n=1 Tax=Azohydromonas caseinilytica TaxID=2728836 RepID=A0A848F936_9BURK|nr:tripartite tricarboxylate transporter substrate binding protein [Azohydromonas caseinilytica]NML15215.1 tripartite tricarboxylate transporter substrate binding protein [Azohydromonas caseinilytica]
MTHRRTLLAVAAATATLACSPVWAQGAASSWPTKPVTIVVPFPAGGGTDTFARPLFAALTKNTGRQFIIDNKGGAGGTLGAGLAARMPADGYSFFMGGVHHAIAPSMYPKLDYNLEKDFIPVGLVSNVPQVVVVNAAKSPAKDLAGLLAQMRARPGQLTYASAGNGTSHHLAGELFKLQTKTFITHIPYRGAGPALQDLMAGQVDMMFDGLGSSAGHIRSGRLKGLAVAGERRAPGFPDIPTARELGVPDYVVSTWYGLWAPKGTPREAIERMQAELKKALNADELKTSWTGLGSETPDLWGEAFGTFAAKETKRWAEVVKASGARLE